MAALKDRRVRSSRPSNRGRQRLSCFRIGRCWRAVNQERVRGPMDLKGVAMVKTPIVEEEKKVEHTAERARNPHREESRRRFGFLFAENEISQRLQNAKTQPEL